MKKLYLFCLLFIVNYDFGLAQSFCANDLLVDSIYKKKFRFTSQQLKATVKWNDYNKALSSTKRIITGSDTSYEIPVVVHVIHTGDTIGSLNNPSDTVIQQLIDYLNHTWAATWPDYADTTAGGTNIPIRFVLAKRSPSCSATNGINRVNAAHLPFYTENGICPIGILLGPSDAEVKRLSLWPTYDYLNIWLVHKIEGGGAAGYAPWPWFTGPELIDGIVMQSAYASPRGVGDYHPTLPHEMGHSLGLFHTFQDGCHPSADCLTRGDELCDTSPHEYDNDTCDIGRINSCDGLLYDEVAYNLMNYTTCPSRFSADQRKRIIFTMNQYRLGLVHSLGALAPDKILVASSCVPNSLVREGKEYGPHFFSFADLQTSSFGYNADDSAYLDRTCIQPAAHVLKGNAYSISIETRDTPQYVKAWIDFDNNGIFATSEMVFAHSGSMDDEFHIGTVMIPTTSVVANKRLRMRIKADVAPIVDACDDLLQGQAEDYSVLVQSNTGVPMSPKEFSWLISPNPVRNIVQISSNTPFVSEWYSADGRLVLLGEDRAQIDLSQLVSGVYWVKLLDPQTRSLLAVDKIVKF